MERALRKKIKFIISRGAAMHRPSDFPAAVAPVRPRDGRSVFWRARGMAIAVCWLAAALPLISFCAPAADPAV